MGDGRVPGPKRKKVAHVLVVTAKGCYNQELTHQIDNHIHCQIIDGCVPNF